MAVDTSLMDFNRVLPKVDKYVKKLVQTDGF